MVRTFPRLLSVFMFVLLGCTAAFCQSEKGQISGQVTDPQGLAVPTIKLQLVNLDNSKVIETESDENGHYSFAHLPAGKYKVTAETEGFTPFTGEEITLAADQAVVYDVKLVVIQGKQSVTVQGGGAGQIETQSAEVSGTINETEVKTLM